MQVSGRSDKGNCNRIAVALVQQHGSSSGLPCYVVRAMRTSNATVFNVASYNFRGFLLAEPWDLTNPSRHQISQQELRGISSNQIRWLGTFRAAPSHCGSRTDYMRRFMELWEEGDLPPEGVRFPEANRWRAPANCKGYHAADLLAGEDSISGNNSDEEEDNDEWV